MGDQRYENPIRQPPTWIPLYELSFGVEALEHRKLTAVARITARQMTLKLPTCSMNVCSYML